MKSTQIKVYLFNLLVILLMIASSSCSSQPIDDPGMAATYAFNSALLTATYALSMELATQVTDTPNIVDVQTITETPLPPTPTIVRTPPDLPQMFTSAYLNPLDVPHTYINDVCQYLKLKWDPNNSAPGTIVMPIMFHNITDDTEKLKQPNYIHPDEVKQMLRDLHDQGFETISMEQLKNFLLLNAKIPSRSVMLIVDDRHYAESYETHFKPSLDEYGWSVVTNAWISTPDSTADLVAGNVRIDQEGWVDHQAHGVIHNIPISNWQSGTIIYNDMTAEQFIHNELFGSITYIENTYGHKPVAYIWPGGGFTEYSINVAKEAGYYLGFTVNPRGPIMFNWIPLSDNVDPMRPSYIPEGTMSDILMVLPRYWDVSARSNIDVVRQIGKAAAQYASDNAQIELDYYDIVCREITGEIPAAVE